MLFKKRKLHSSAMSPPPLPSAKEICVITNEYVKCILKYKYVIRKIFSPPDIGFPCQLSLHTNQ